MQTDGKIVVAAPRIAALIAEQAADSERIFTMPGLPEETAYVLDLDVIFDISALDRNFEKGGGSSNDKRTTGE